MKITALLLFVFLAIAFIAIGAAARPALDTAVTLAAQPDSVADTIMRSRQTPPVAPARGGHGWMVAAVIGIGAAAVAGMLAYLNFGAEFLRQRRLLNRRQSHAPRTLPPMPHAPMLPGQQPYQLPPPDYQTGEGYSD
ncbi:MAG: hypothetical protein KF770_17605 [Anaerolineae bacterium]|nr:hypothetical protein [Anaerolineae bacterium]